MQSIIKTALLATLSLFFVVPSLALAQSAPSISLGSIPAESDSSVDVPLTISGLPENYNDARQVRVVFMKHDAEGGAVAVPTFSAARACSEMQSQPNKWYVGSINIDYPSFDGADYTFETSARVSVVSPTASGNTLHVTNGKIELNARYNFTNTGDSKKIYAFMMFNPDSTDFTFDYSNDCRKVTQLVSHIIDITSIDKDADKDEDDDDGSGALFVPGMPEFGTISLGTISTLLEPSNGTIPLVNKFIDILLLLAGFFLVTMIIYSGIILLTADTEDQAAKAKNNLTWAVYGTITILLANWLVDFIIRFLNR